MLSIIILLMLTACDRAGDNIPQNEPSESSRTPQIETTPDSESVTDSLSYEPEEIENGENDMTNISITVSDSELPAKARKKDKKRY